MDPRCIPEKFFDIKEKGMGLSLSESFQHNPKTL